MATEHKTEQKVIDAIEELRMNKMGLRQIARCLSQMGGGTDQVQGGEMASGDGEEDFDRLVRRLT